MLVKQRFLIEGRCDLGTSNLTSEEEKPTTEMEELLLQGKEMEDHNKFIVDLANALGYNIAFLKSLHLSNQNIEKQRQ